MTKEGELAKRTKTKFHFPHDDFDFFFQWILGGQSHGSSEVGECFYAASAIKDGDSQSWGEAWTALAKRTERRARASLEQGHLISAQEAFFRSYSYRRAPLVFMNPRESSYRSLYEKARANFQQAASLGVPPIQPLAILFGGGSLPGYLVQLTQDVNPRKTLLMIGGGDTFVEDLYFYIGPAGTKRGYNVVIVDLPGQGILPSDGLVMQAEAELSLKIVVDHVLDYPQVHPEKLAVFGISAGGYLVPRGATVEKRIKACIASSVILNFYEVWTRNAGLERIAAIENSGLLRWVQRLPIRRLRAATHLLQTYTWRWGVETVRDLLESSRSFVFDPREIHCPTLILIGETEYERFEASREWAHQCMDGVANSKKKLIVAPRNEGAGGHALGTNLSLMSQLTFDWLDERFDERN